MLRLAPVGALAAVLLLVAIPAAQAQTPANPTVTVTLETGAPPTIALGETGTVKVNVKLDTNYIFCQNPGTMSVGIAITDAGLPGVTATAPSSIDIPIKANVGQASAQTTSSGNATLLLTVTVAKSTTPDHDHAFTITASTPATTPSGCQTLTTMPPPVSKATKDASIRTGPALAMSGTMTGTSGSDTSSSTKKSFFVPLQLEIGILLVAGLLRRRD